MPKKYKNCVNAVIVFSPSNFIKAGFHGKSVTKYQALFNGTLKFFSMF